MIVKRSMKLLSIFMLTFFIYIVMFMIYFTSSGTSNLTGTSVHNTYYTITETGKNCL
jgi:hypothetical protein